MLMRMMGAAAVLALAMPFVTFAAGAGEAGAASSEEYSLDQFEPVAGKEYVLEWCFRPASDAKPRQVELPRRAAG